MRKFELSEINKMPESSGIYSITNTLNNHRYIGSTNNFKRRLERHRSELRKNYHHSLHLQRAYNKYGEIHFKVEILEFCEPIRDTLLSIEQKYLDLNPEYNIAEIADRPVRTSRIVSDETKMKIRLANIGRKHSEESRKKMSEAQRKKPGKKVDQYDLNGKYIQTFDRVVDAGIAMGNYYKHVQITSCCKGRTRTACGYIWKYHNDNRNIFEVQKPKGKDNKRPVICLTKKNEYVAEFPSILEAAIALGNATNSGTINKVVHGKGKTAFGYKWKYKEDYERSVV